MKYPSYCCQKCGEQIGWLGRFVEFCLGWAGLRHACQRNQIPMRRMTPEERRLTDEFIKSQFDPPPTP